MTTKHYIELDWDEIFEPLFGSPIIIPTNTILWRGYDTRYNPISDRFTYFSSMNVVLEYAKKKHRELGCFATTRPLKILDIRFMSNILDRFIQNNITQPNINDFASTIISFGLCSLSHQITLVKQRYRDTLNKNNSDAKLIQLGISKMIEIHRPHNIIEQRGIRIAETTNDAITMTFLQELFKDTFDGFIAPRLQTVFHTEKAGQLHPELILFNPKMAHIIQLTHYPSLVGLQSIQHLYSDKHQLINLQDITNNGKAISIKMYMTRGGAAAHTYRHHLDDFDDRLNRNHHATLMLYNNTIKSARAWRKYLSIINPDETVPHARNVHSFTRDSLEGEPAAQID